MAHAFAAKEFLGACFVNVLCLQLSALPFSDNTAAIVSSGRGAQCTQAQGIGDLVLTGTASARPTGSPDGAAASRRCLRARPARPQRDPSGISASAIPPSERPTSYTHGQLCPLMTRKMEHQPHQSFILNYHSIPQGRWDYPPCDPRPQVVGCADLGTLDHRLLLVP